MTVPARFGEWLIDGRAGTVDRRSSQETARARRAPAAGPRPRPRSRGRRRRPGRGKRRTLGRRATISTAALEDARSDGHDESPRSDVPTIMPSATKRRANCHGAIFSSRPSCVRSAAQPIAGRARPGRRPSRARRSLAEMPRTSAASSRYRPAKKRSFDQFGLARVLVGQLVQGLVEGQDFRVAGRRHRQCIAVEVQPLPAAAALDRPACARACSTRMRRMASAAAAKKWPRPFQSRGCSAADQPEVGLVDQGGRPGASGRASPRPAARRPASAARRRPAGAARRRRAGRPARWRTGSA